MSARIQQTVSAPWWGPHLPPHAPAGRLAWPEPAAAPRFRVRGRAGSDLAGGVARLTAWALLWGLFLLAVQ